MTLLLLGLTSPRFHLKYEEPNFESPEMRLDHLRLESDLSDLLVCFVEKPIGITPQDQSPIFNFFGKKRFAPLMMHLCDVLRR